MQQAAEVGWICVGQCRGRGGQPCALMREHLPSCGFPLTLPPCSCSHHLHAMSAGCVAVCRTTLWMYSCAVRTAFSPPPQSLVATVVSTVIRALCTSDCTPTRAASAGWRLAKSRGAPNTSAPSTAKSARLAAPSARRASTSSSTHCSTSGRCTCGCARTGAACAASRLGSGAPSTATCARSTPRQRRHWQGATRRTTLVGGVTAVATVRSTWGWRCWRRRRALRRRR